MGNPPAVPFGEVTAQHPKEDSGPGTDDHEENPGCNSSCEVRKEKDSNPRVHQNRQHDARDAPCHASTSLCCPGINRKPRVYFTARLRPVGDDPLSAIHALWYCTSYSDELAVAIFFGVFGALQSLATVQIRGYAGFSHL
jgi:hypothetical protein